MVSMEKVQAGITAFIDKEIAPGLSGWDKVVVAGGAGLLTSRLPNVLNGLSENSVFSALAVYDKENAAVDVDALYTAITPYLGTERLPLKIPFIGVTLKIGKPELELLHKYIMEG